MDDLHKLTRARNDPFGPKKRAKFLKAFAQTGNISYSCRQANITRPTYYDTIARDPEFAAAVLDADEEATESLEAVAWHKARVEKDNTSLWNLLKARRPQKYREPVQRIAQTDVDGNNITLEERAARVAAIFDSARARRDRQVAPSTEQGVEADRGATEQGI